MRALADMKGKADMDAVVTDAIAEERERIVRKRAKKLIRHLDEYFGIFEPEDGEVVAWGSDGIRPFAELQRRLNRKRISA